MAVATGKGGKKKHFCPPIPAGWEQKVTGPEAVGPSFHQAGLDIENGKFIEEIDENGRVWKVHPSVPENRRRAIAFRRFLGSGAIRPMPSQRRGSAHAA